MAGFTAGPVAKVVDLHITGVTKDDLDALELAVKHGTEAVQALPVDAGQGRRAEPYLSENQLKFLTQIRGLTAQVRGTL